jgi:PAS domain S-box-containing protein
MKVFVQTLAARLLRLPPLTSAVIGFVFLVALAMAHNASPGLITFTSFYLIGAGFLGWTAGFWPAAAYSLIAAIVMAPQDWAIAQNQPGHAWIVYWNVGTRWLVFSAAGAVTTKLASLTRSLSSLVEQRTVQLRQETEEHKATSARLTQANEAMKTQAAILENMAEAVVLTDENGIITLTNPALDRLLGYERGELIGKALLGISTLPMEELRDALRADIETVKRTGESISGEYIARRKDGAEIQVATRNSGVSVGGRFFLIVAGQDITERKRAELALARQEKLYRTLFELCPDGILLEDTAGNILDVNDAVCKSLGFPRDELVGQSVRIFVPAEAHVEVDTHLNALRAGAILEHEVWNVRKSGERRLMRLSEKPIGLPDGRQGIMAVARDITDRKQAEEQIRLLADAVQSTSEMISITDYENRFIFANRAFLETYGYREEEILGRKPDFLYSPTNPPGLCEQVFQQTLGGGWRGELFNWRKDGTELPVSLTTSQIRDDQNKVIGLLGVARDITERRRAEQRNLAFAQLGHRLSAATRPEQAAEIIFEAASDLFEWDAGYIALYAAAEDRIIPMLTFDMVNGRRTSFPPTSMPQTPTPLMRRVMKEGPQLLQGGSRAAAGVELVPFGNPGQRSVSAMFVPINSGHQVVGLLSVQSTTATVYSKDDLQLLQSLAERCADALQRIKVTEALREAEASYRSIFEHATEGIFQTTRDGRLLSANPALARIFGYSSPEEMVSAVTDVARQLYVKPENREALKQALESRGSVQGFEIENYRKDRRRIWVSLNAHLVSDATGAVRRFEGTVQDITERKMAEAALRESEERYRTLAESSPDAIFILGPDIKVRYMNSTAAALWKREPKDLLGLRQEELFPLETARHQEEVVKEIFATGETVQRDVQIPFPQGRRWHETRLVPIRDEQGEVAAVMGVSRDITERKQTEQQLADALDLNEKMLAASPMGIIAYKASGECVFVNQAMGRISGGSEEELRAGNFRRLAAWRRSGLFRLAEQALEAGEARSGEFRDRTRFGKTVWVDTYMIPFVSGAERHLLVMAYDISERKGAELLLRAQRDLGAGLSSISDLRTAAERLLATGVQLEGIDCGAIFLIDAATGGLELKAARNLSAEFVEHVARFPADSAQARLVGKGQPVYGHYARLPEAQDTIRKREGLRAAAIVPLCHAGTILGSMNLSSRVEEEIPRRMQLVIEGIANQAAGAIARIRAEEALRQSEARLRAFITAAPVLLFAADRDGMITLEDGLALKALAVKPGARAGQSVHKVFGQSPAMLENVRRVLEGEEFSDIVEVGAVAFDCWYSPVRDKNGTVTGFNAVGTNITERYRLERQILEISDREQGRIGQDIHDGLCQHLVSLAFDANSLQEQLCHDHHSEAARAGRIAGFLDEAITESRRLARGLFPVRLESEGLSPALQELANATASRFKVRCDFCCRGNVAVRNSAIATHLYRIAQEAVNNAVRHGKPGVISIQLDERNEELELQVSDDGKGFGPKSVDQAKGMGLHIMDYRARAIGGTLRFSGGAGRGVTISCCIPRQPIQ